MTLIPEQAEAFGASPDEVEQALARGVLGTPQVTSSMMSALGPLLVAAGTFPSAIAATGRTALPAACILIAAVLGLFLIGYLAMARYVVNPGAFYAMTGAGLGRPAGVAAGWLAMVGYGAMQVSLFGLIGTELAQFISDNDGGRWTPGWWEGALLMLLVVGAIGQTKVELNTRFLLLLASVEVAILLVLSASGLMHPAAGGLRLGPFNPARITWAGLGSLAAIVTLCFVGVEQSTVYMTEVRDKRRTLPRATILTLAGGTVFFVAAAFAMDTHYGSGIVSAAGQLGPDLFFHMSSGWRTATGHLMFLSGISAAMIAYQNTMARYIYSAARAGTLPSFLARTGRSGVPRSASLLQSAFGALAIGATQLFRWDPMATLFYASSSFGGFTIMGLFALTGIAVVCFFARDHRGERALVRLWVPLIAALCLTGMVIACIANLPNLLGLSPNDPTIPRLYALLALAVLAALARCVYLRARRPEVYARLARPAKRVARAESVPAGAR